MGRAYVQSSALLDHPWSPKMSGASGEEPAGQYTQCAAGATTGPMEVEGVKAAAEAAPVAAFAEATLSPAADSGAAARRGGAARGGGGARGGGRGGRGGHEAAAAALRGHQAGEVRRHREQRARCDVCPAEEGGP
mmetsp:Transcript_6052/g.24041  ORF Transcript_6052/g.24041 Transcript_6052/m.24041 type:complete len:135 (-) Transcript_6052:319-723(-)